MQLALVNWSLVAVGLVALIVLGAPGVFGGPSLGKWTVDSLSQAVGPITLAAGTTYEVKLWGCLPQGSGEFPITVAVTAVEGARMVAGEAKVYHYALERGTCLAGRTPLVFTVDRAGDYMLNWSTAQSMVDAHPKLELRVRVLDPAIGLALVTIGGTGAVIAVAQVRNAWAMPARSPAPPPAAGPAPQAPTAAGQPVPVAGELGAGNGAQGAEPPTAPCPKCGTPVFIGAPECARCGLAIEWDG